MKYPVYNQSGEKVKDVELNPAIFEVSVKAEVVQQVVVAQAANKRANLAHTKTRSEVRGGGRKPWRQKGTGRARHGSIRSPLWRGGGVTFGPRNERNFSKKVNKKMKRKALFMSLSDKAQDKHLILLNELKLDEVKTKKFVELMSSLFSKVSSTTGTVKKQALPKTLIISPQSQRQLILASRNLQKVRVIRADSLNVRDVLDHIWLVVPLDSLSVIEKIYLTDK